MVATLKSWVAFGELEDAVFTQGCLKDLGGLVELTLNHEDNPQQVISLKRVTVLVTEFIEISNK